jgi:hypothetical protein
MYLSGAVSPFKTIHMLAEYVLSIDNEYQYRMIIIPTAGHGPAWA